MDSAKNFEMMDVHEDVSALTSYSSMAMCYVCEIELPYQ